MTITIITRIFFEMPRDYTRHEMFKKNNVGYRLISETSKGYLYEKEDTFRDMKGDENV